jgi:hypothetical protein
VSVGNDVVDLEDPETNLLGLHRRWDERVFSAAERGALEASHSRHVQHWAFWAAKESAYKALSRLEPATVFSPREFEVELPTLPTTRSGVAVGRVVHDGRELRLEVRLDGASVHAVATSENEVGARVLSQVGQVRGDPGTAARRLAAGAIGSALGTDPAGLRICGRPPVATLRGHRLEVGLSLSHHGRFVAFACTLDGTRASPVLPGARAADAQVRSVGNPAATQADVPPTTL